MYHLHERNKELERAYAHIKSRAKIIGSEIRREDLARRLSRKEAKKVKHKNKFNYNKQKEINHHLRKSLIKKNKEINMLRKENVGCSVLWQHS